MQKQHNDMMAHLRKLIQRNKDLNFNIAMKPKDVTRGLAYALKTGNWNTNRNQPSNSSKNQGVSQILNRLNYIAPLSHLRRTTASDTTLSVVRQQHNTQYGTVCPSETPEGQSCLTLDTLILTPSGNIPIGNLKNGDKVISVDSITYETSVTTIYNYFQKKCIINDIQITGGWSIKATDDHPFLTKHGWKEVKDISVADNVYLKYVQTQYEHSIKEEENILESILNVSEVKQSILEKNNQKLENMGLLPLKNNDRRLPIIARMFGYIISNGCITTDKRATSSFIQLCFDQKVDSEEFQNDCKLLGFEKRESKDGREINQTPYRTCHHGSIAYLFMALGVPYGKKTVKSYTLPDWILNGSKLVKREFLSGFQGGDGGSNRTVESLDNRMIFEELFKEFDSNVKQEEYCSYLMIRFSDEFQNIIAYMENIGYRYASSKTEKGVKAYFYLLHKLHIWNKKIQMYNDIKNMVGNGSSIEDVISKYRFLRRRQIIEIYNLPIPKCPKMVSFEKFIDENYNNKGCFMQISSITKSSESSIVADFTTVSNNHSFIANDIVTHNCGIVKNLALLCHVSKGTDAYNVYKWLKENVNYVPVTLLNPNKLVYGWKIFVNGNYLGIYPTEDKSERCFHRNKPISIPLWVYGFRHARSLGMIDEDVSISTHTR